MSVRRGLFRLFFFVSVLFWGAAVAYALDAGAGYGPAGFYASEQVLKLAGTIYLVFAGLVWTLYGFFPKSPGDA